MKQVFKPGDSKQIHYTVKSSDFATFNKEVVHAVCSTFTLAREIEWATRQFVLEMRDEDEEGIGTFITIDHKGPAFEGDILVIDGWVDSIEGHELICSYIVRTGNRIVASGKTGQKILKKEKLKQVLQPK